MLIVRAVLVLLLMLATDIAYSQNPIPSETKEDTGLQQQTKHTNNLAIHAQNGTEKQPLFVKIVDAKKTDSNAAKDENKGGEKPLFIWGMSAEEATSIFTFALVIIGALTALVMICQSYMLRRSVNLARKEFISTHRPQIRVRNFVVRQPKSVFGAEQALFAEESPVEIRFYIANIGGTCANVTGVGCWVRAFLGEANFILPMERPYEGLNPNVLCLRTQNSSEFVKVEAGESSPIIFYTDEPLEPDIVRYLNTGVGRVIEGTLTGIYKLFVMGFVEYSDDMGTPRRTNFCREFAAEKRFVKVENEDYESES